MNNVKSGVVQTDRLTLSLSVSIIKVYGGNKKIMKRREKAFCGPFVVQTQNEHACNQMVNQKTKYKT